MYVLPETDSQHQARLKANYIITLRIHAISLVESHDLLQDRRTELRHKILKCRKYLKIPLHLYKFNEFMPLNL